MTRNEYNQTVETLASIDRFHRAMTPAHIAHDCLFCRSLDERRYDLAAQWGWVAVESKSG